MPAVAQQVLFIQGAGARAHDDWDAKLVTSLERELGDDYEVCYPRMPQEDDPSYGRWSAAIGHELATAQDGVIVVGHSMGATILAAYLAHEPQERRLGPIVLIAAPFVGAGGWPSEEIALTEDLGPSLPRGVPVHLFYGLDDQTVPPNHVDLYSRAIPHSHVHLLPDRDHQLNDDLSEVVARAIEIDHRKGSRT